VDSLPTVEALTAAIDAEALHWWQTLGHGPDVPMGAGVDGLPGRLRGPFTWDRLDNETEVAP
jgi:hypothetical protein